MDYGGLWLIRRCFAVARSKSDRLDAELAAEIESGWMDWLLNRFGPEVELIAGAVAGEAVE
jgi:hypothetical protein